MTVRTRANDLHAGGKIRTPAIVALEQLPQSFNLAGRPVRKVGDGAVVDLALFAEGLAQEDGRGRVAVGNYRHIHVDTIVTVCLCSQEKTCHIHDYKYTPKTPPVLENNQPHMRSKGELRAKNSTVTCGFVSGHDFRTC